MTDDGPFPKEFTMKIFTTIPWGIKIKGITNTCRLDSLLTLFHYWDVNNALKKPLELDMNHVLSKSLAMLRRGNFNKARIIWKDLLMCAICLSAPQLSTGTLFFKIVNQEPQHEHSPHAVEQCVSNRRLI